MKKERKNLKLTWVGVIVYFLWLLGSGSTMMSIAGYIHEGFNIPLPWAAGITLLVFSIITLLVLRFIVLDTIRLIKGSLLYKKYMNKKNNEK